MDTGERLSSSIVSFSVGLKWTVAKDSVVVIKCFSFQKVKVMDTDKRHSLANNYVFLQKHLKLLDSFSINNDIYVE